MKPFNLEQFKAGKIALTRDGQEAKFVAYVPEAEDTHQLVVLNGGVIYGLYANGRALDRTTSSYDLTHMKPEKKTVWVNLYEHGCSTYYTTEEEANKEATPIRINGKAYPVEIDV